MGNAGGQRRKESCSDGKDLEERGWDEMGKRDGACWRRGGGGGAHIALSGGEPGSLPSDASRLELIPRFSEDVHLITLK